MLTEPTRADRAGQVQSLVRAFTILEALASGPAGLTLTEIARAVGLPRSTAHRLLTTMEGLHFVEFRASTFRWSVGIRAYSVGAAVADARVIERLSQPILRGLMVEARETVSVSVPDSLGLRIANQAVPGGTMPAADAGVGALLPWHATASGKAVLSRRSAREVADHLARLQLKARTSRSLTTGAAVAADVERARLQGFAIDDEEYAAGVRCVAAPILDPRGIVRAALSITGPAARLGDERLAELGAKVVGAAGRLGEALPDVRTAHS